MGLWGGLAPCWAWTGRAGTCRGALARGGSGVLVAGSAAGEVAAARFRFVHAAIRRRKLVLVVDLDGVPGLAAALAAICAAAGAPLHVFGAGGPGCYDPLRGGDPARNAALVLGMIDWAAVAGPARRTGAATCVTCSRCWPWRRAIRGSRCWTMWSTCSARMRCGRGCARCRRITRAARRWPGGSGPRPAC